MGTTNLFRLLGVGAGGSGRKLIFSVGPSVIRSHPRLSKVFTVSQKGGIVESIRLGRRDLAKTPETAGASNIFSAIKWLCDLNQSLNY